MMKGCARTTNLLAVTCTDHEPTGTSGDFSNTLKEGWNNGNSAVECSWPVLGFK